MVARLVTLNSGQTVPDDGALEAVITFFPPDKRGRDVDNLLASLKPTLDGIFDALGTNDRRIRRTVLEWGERELAGRVVIEIKPLVRGYRT